MNNKKKSQGLLLALLACLVVSLFVIGHPATKVMAQEPTPSEDEVNAIARQLFCPVCENTPLEVCDTEACRQWRNLIRQMLAEGKSEEEIRAYFAENYGARVLAEPPLEGFNLLAYIVPPVAFLLGAGLLWRALRIWKKVGNPSTAADGEKKTAATGADSFQSKFEDELKKRR